MPAPETFSSKTAADRWLARKRAELDAGTAVDERAGNRPLSDWWPAYERTIVGLKTSTRANYGAAWRLRIEPRFGDVRVRRIKPSDVDDWVSQMITDGVSTSKITESLGVLRRVLDRVVRDKVIPLNPCAERSVTLPRRQQTTRPVLSPADIESLVAQCNHERDKILIRLLAYGGLRINEALALRWESVNLKARTLTVRESVASANGHVAVGPTKTYATRTIDLPSKLTAQLAEYSGGGTLVFPNSRGSYVRYRNWRRDVWDRAVEAAGIDALPHDLRATCASLLIDSGASVKDVQKHLGHEDELTTLRLYARVRPGRSVDLASRLDALIAEVG